MTSRIQCTINNINGSTIKRIYNFWFLIRIGKHNFLSHRNDINCASQSHTNRYFQVNCTAYTIEHLVISEDIFILNFIHFSTTGGQTIKFSSTKNSQKSINIYIFETYFRLKIIPGGSFSPYYGCDLLLVKVWHIVAFLKAC